MGCHTWCYKRVERTIEEAREIWIKEQLKSIESFEEIAADPNHLMRQDTAYPEWTQEVLDNWLSVAKRQLRMVEKGLCNFAVMNKQPELSFYIEGKGFYVNTEFHDPFRIGVYPDDILYSYDECIEFIKKYEKKHSTVVRLWEDGESLKEFWKTYPDGCIDFG